jgi:hypothetical protein
MSISLGKRFECHDPMQVSVCQSAGRISMATPRSPSSTSAPRCSKDIFLAVSTTPCLVL